MKSRQPCGAGVPPAVFLPLGGALKIRSRRLPHWEVERAVYFVTFRLAGSLPKSALREIALQRTDVLKTASRAGRALTTVEEKKLRQLHGKGIEEALDKGGGGECFLQIPSVAEIVANALAEFDGPRYRLFAWSIMPNHVHVLFELTARQSLSPILHSWKSFSAKRANQFLGRSGEFWQREYYDHLIRDAEEFDRAKRYILENPVKASLPDWRWVWYRE